VARDGKVSFLVRRRWLRDDPERRLPRALRWVGERAIFVLVPAIGFLWADGSRVRPIVTEIDATRILECGQLKTEKNGLQAEMSELRWERVSIRAALDTLYLPAIAQRRALCDSLRAMREDHVRRPTVTQAQVDSLNAVHDQLALQVTDLQEAHWTRVSVLNNLDSWQYALRDSIMCVGQRALAQRDEPGTLPKKGFTVRSVLTHIGYVVAPMIGYLWVRES
jgi:hypothetical protein